MRPSLLYSQAILCAVAVFAACGDAPAQPQQPIRVQLGGQPRGVVFDATRSKAFVALYDADEIAVVDTPSLSVEKTIKVAGGPSDLALSAGGDVLAVVCRLAEEVYLLSTSSHHVSHSVRVGRGPGAITSLPGGGFAVANAFADSVTLIDESTGTLTATLNGIYSVPVSMAASDAYLTVGTREPPAIHLFRPGQEHPETSIPLPGIPRAIRAIGIDRFIAATPAGVVAVAADGSIDTLAEGDWRDVAVVGERISTLGRGGLLRGIGSPAADRTLVPVETPAWALADSGAVHIVSRPVAREILIWTHQPREDSDARARPDLNVMTATSPLVPSRPTVPVDRAETGPEGDWTSREPLLATLSNDFDETGTPEPSESVPPLVPSKPPAPDERSLREQSKRERREKLYSLRPPRENIGGNAPYAPILGEAAGESFMDTLEKGMIFGVGGGATDYRWDEIREVENLSFEEGEINRGEPWVFEGNVRFRLDDALGRADRLVVDRSTDLIGLSGDVRIQRDTSMLEASELSLHYRQVSEAAEPGAPLAPPLIPSGYGREDDETLGFGEIESRQLRLSELDRTLEADYFRYDLSGQRGELLDARGHAGPVYFEAAALRILGPASLDGDDVWVTTCDLDPPHYRIRIKRAQLQRGEYVVGTNARLQLGRVNTPIFIPRWQLFQDPTGRRGPVDFDIGHGADIGYFLNAAQWITLTPDVEIGLRVYPSEEESMAGGIDGRYDFMNATTSPLFRGRGRWQTLYTSEERGYLQFYHRQEFIEDTVALLQWEQWSDSDFVKDFYNEEFDDRTGPRTFANVTHIGNGYFLTATASKRTVDFTAETEKLPEVTYHLIERRLAKNLYATFDSFAGFYDREPVGISAARMSEVVRVSYDLNLNQGLNVLPFIESDATWYSHTFDRDSDLRFSTTGGVTAQSRLHRVFSGAFGFSAFKHIVLPSVTFSRRQTFGLESEDTPRFDDLDDRPGRTRVESKLDNVLLGRNASTGEEWQVARLTLYQGNDLSNEFSETQDYEIELEVRPRPTWGLQAIAEHHGVDPDTDDPGTDFSRVLAYLFYDDAAVSNLWNGRLGFAFTKSGEDVFNEEILYGLGYKISANWSVAFEQRYDFERDEITRQTYELRRRLHKWETALRLRERESGVDFSVQFSLTDFPGFRFRM